jgi:tetratricopeptide (TPR) repeat protein
MLVSRAIEGCTVSTATDIERAEELSRQALAVSPRSPLAHYAKGQVLLAQKRYAEAVPNFETAISFDRYFVSAYADLGWCKFLAGSIEKAIPLVEQAICISPRGPYISCYHSMIGVMHLAQSGTDEAILWLEKVHSANSELPQVHILLASAYGLKGETERAAAELTEARRLHGGDRYSSIARLRAFSSGYSGVPKIRTLFEATYFAGLRKAGMPDE